MKRSLPLVICTAAASIYLAACLHRGWRHANRYADHPDYQVYGRVEYWVRSARCTQERGVFLAACGTQGRLYPIENVSLNEDRGHTLLADLVASRLSVPFSTIHLVRLNMALNAVAVLALAALLALIRRPWAALFTLIAGAAYGVPGPLPGPDLQSALFGIYLLSVIGPLWAAALGRDEPRGAWRIAGHALAVTALVWTVLLRSPFGVTTVLLTLAVTFARLRWETPAPRRLPLLGLGLAAMLSLGSTAALMSLRNRLFTMEPTQAVFTHGFAHNLYIGLGTEPNPWGINYSDDAYGLWAAQRVKPDVVFCSPEYFRVLRGVYLGIWRRDPATVIRLYARKAWRIFELPLTFLDIPFRFIVVGTLILGIVLRRRARDDHARQSLRVLAVLYASLLFLVLQGVLTKPDFQFLYPLKIAMALLVIVAAQAAIPASRVVTKHDLAG